MHAINKFFCVRRNLQAFRRVGRNAFLGFVVELRFADVATILPIRNRVNLEPLRDGATVQVEHDVVVRGVCDGKRIEFRAREAQKV